MSKLDIKMLVQDVIRVCRTLQATCNLAANDTLSIQYTEWLRVRLDTFSLLATCQTLLESIFDHFDVTPDGASFTYLEQFGETGEMVKQAIALYTEVLKTKRELNAGTFLGK